jgi:hypothetical protein
VQEQLFGVLRAALDASLRPLLETQQQLEARLERLQAADQRAAASVVSSSDATTAAAPELASSASVAAQLPAKASPAKAAPIELVASVAPKASLVPTSYGFVIAPSVAPPRPAIDVALENVGAIDIPDFGRRRRAAGNVLVGLLLAGVAAAIAATILSYT